MAKLLARAVREVVDPELRAFEGRLCEELVNKIAPIFRAELDDEREERQAAIREINERVAALERHVFRDTLPAPSSAPGGMGGE